MRLFTAIELSQGAREHLAKLAIDLRNTWNAKWPQPTWTPVGNLHLTLKFVGEVAEADLPRWLASIQSVSKPGPIRLRAQHLELLPPHGPVRIIAAGLIGDEGSLTELVDSIERILLPLGCPREARKYLPHVTLARARRPLPPESRRLLSDAAKLHLPGREFRAERLVVMESRLARGESAAPTYSPIVHIDLG